MSRLWPCLLLVALGCGDRTLPACKCPTVVDPVCGINGVTYPSACRAACLGERIRRAGDCSADGPTDCSCPGGGDPVCGTDLATYTSACAASCAGAAIAHAGACVTTPDGGAAADGGRTDAGRTDGGGDAAIATGACHIDSDCYADFGCSCGATCLSIYDPPPAATPDGGCLLGCASQPLPWNCHCEATGVCAAGGLPVGALCNHARDTCTPGSMCCPTSVSPTTSYECANVVGSSPLACPAL
jgi:YHS domain-containing protein